MKPDSYFWFLWALWVISVLFIVGDRLSTKLNIKQEFIIGLISLILVAIMVFFDCRLLGFQFISYYFIFYAIGYYCNKYKRLLTANKFVLCLLFLIWFGMSSFWNMHELPFFLKGIPYIPTTMLQYVYRFISAFVAIYLLICVAPMLFNTTNKFNTGVAHLGKISLGVYVVHLMLIVPISPCLVGIMPDTPVPVTILISFLLSSIISIIIVELLNKNNYTSRFLLGKI